MNVPQENIRVSGALTYRERIALPPGAQARIVLINADKTILDQQIIDLDGRQVPIGFKLRPDPDTFNRDTDHFVEGHIYGPDETLMWVTSTVPIGAGRAGRVQLGNILMTAAGPLPPESPPEATPEPAEDSTSSNYAFEAAEWQVLIIGQKDLPDGFKATLDFSKNGRLSGLTGCNRYSTRYEASYETRMIDGEEIIGGNFTVNGPLTMTQRACFPDMSAHERRFMDILSRVTSWVGAADGTLILRTDDGDEIHALL